MKIKSFFLIRFSCQILVQPEPTNKAKKFLPSWGNSGLFSCFINPRVHEPLQGMFLYIIQADCFLIPWSALLGQALADDSQPWVMTSDSSSRPWAQASSSC